MLHLFQDEQTPVRNRFIEIGAGLAADLMTAKSQNDVYIAAAGAAGKALVAGYTLTAQAESDPFTLVQSVRNRFRY